MDVTDITSVLQMIDSNINKKVRILIIGGSAMAILQDKVVTKDIDCAIPDEDAFKEFIRCAYDFGFEPDPSSIPEEERGIILRNPNGFRMDIFSKRICNKFLIHEGIMNRAERLNGFSSIETFIMSREDIFISKSITERDVDLSDMFSLYKRGLDEDIIIEELNYQTNNTGIIWEAFMTVKLLEVEERFDVTIPMKNRINSIAVDKMKNVFEP